MPFGTDRRTGRPAGPTAATAAVQAAVLAAVLASVLAGCGPGGSGHQASTPRSGIGPGFVRVFGYAGGGGVVAIAGPAQLAGGTGRPAITMPPIPPADSGQVIPMPLDGYEQVQTADQNALTQAQAVLVQRCMTERGFVYDAAAPNITGAAQVQAIETDPIGVTSLAQAREFGFAQPGQNGPNGTFAIFLGGFAFSQSVRQNGPAWTSALTGFTPGAQGRVRHQGCLQLAAAAIYGPLGPFADPDPVPQIALQAVSWTRSDARILAAERAWSRCMRRHGYSYRTPAQVQDRGWPRLPTAAEVAAAVADVSCKTLTNLANTWLAVQAAYQQALIGQNLASLAQLEGHFKRLLLRAENVVAGGSLPAGQSGQPAGPGPVQVIVPASPGSG